MKAEHEKIFQEFVLWLRIRGYKERGIESKERAAKHYLEYAEIYSVNIAMYGIREAEAYRENMRLAVSKYGKPRYNPKTINGRITELVLFYRYLIERGEAARNPFKYIERMKESRNLPKNILTTEEMGKLLGSMPLKTFDDLKFKTVIELLYSTGARINEIENLKKENIYLEKGYILILDDKERQDRRSPLTEISGKFLELFFEINEYSDKDYVFFHGRKRSLNRWINDRLKSITKKLELPKITCHGIRHTIATHLLQKGADLREVQEFLGHKRIKNTEIYTHLLTEDLKEVIEKTHPREMKFLRLQGKQIAEGIQ